MKTGKHDFYLEDDNNIIFMFFCSSVFLSKRIYPILILRSRELMSFWSWDMAMIVVSVRERR